MNWVGWSRQRSCTKEACHPNRLYVFKHALIQDTAYQSLLKSTRQQYHQRIAQVFEAQFAETAEAEPELLAHHYTEAGLQRKQSTIGITLVREPFDAQHMQKRLRIFVKDSRYSKRSPRHHNVSNAK